MSGHTVLIADDDALVRRFLVEALASLGARAVEAGTGAEALAALASSPFDAFFADLRMPGPSGAALARVVQQRLGSGAPRMFAMSGELDAADRARLLSAGYADALQKPIPRARLARLLGIADGTRETPSRRVEADIPALDDDAAMRALGSGATVGAMRGLLLEDLPAQRAALAGDVAAGRREAAVAALHRLRAACGFCGTPRLAAASTALQRALEHGQELDRLHSDWQDAARELEAALAQR